MDLYAKTTSVGELPNSTTTNTRHGISKLLRIYQMYGIAVNSTGNNIPLPLAHASSVEGSILIAANKTNIQVTSGQDRSSYSGDVTLVYTKSS